MARQLQVWRVLGAALVVGGSIATVSSTVQAQSYPDSGNSSEIANTRFACEVMGSEYTVMYYPQSQPGQSYAWATPSAMGGGWTPQARCVEISRRLESYRPDGLLEMRTAIENGYDTICVTTERVPSCRIVLTVPEGEDPIAIRDRVFSNLTVADSGQSTAPVATFNGSDDGIFTQIGEALGINLPGYEGRSASRSDAINLRPFLDPADGGTGSQLGGSSGLRFNDGFR